MIVESVYLAETLSMAEENMTISEVLLADATALRKRAEGNWSNVVPWRWVRFWREYRYIKRELKSHVERRHALEARQAEVQRRLEKQGLPTW